MSALPWFKFYPADWRADPGLRACSAAARALWIDLICIMHEAKPYGHLLINGKPPSYYQISQLVGMDLRTVRNSMAQLEKNGVFTCISTCDSTCVPTSRKMVRNKLKSQTARELSKFRWGEKTYALEARKKERGLTEESKGRKTSTGTNARHAWENHLLKQLGPDGYARAMDVLAANPAIVDRATRAERRQPGSGAMAAILALRQNGPAPKP